MFSRRGNPCGCPGQAQGLPLQKKWFYVLAGMILVSSILISTSAFASVTPKTIVKGQATTINVEYEIGDVAVTDPSICDYLVGQDRRSIYVNARGVGETSVTLWNREGIKKDEYSVRVVTSTLKEAFDRAKEDFGEFEGVKLNVRGNRVEVEGEVAEPDDFKRIEERAKSDPFVKSRVRLTRDVISQIADAIKSELDVPGVTVRSVRDRVVLEGIAYSQTDAKRAAQIAQLYAPDVLDLIEVSEVRKQVGRGKMIELTFHMMEVKKEALKQFGINWAPGSFPNGGGGNASAGGGGGLLSSIGDMGKELIGFVFQLIPKLKFANERGDGRVLENPSVIVKSGEEAKIFSGTEIPYYKGEDVQFKKVGIDISAFPIEVANGVDVKLTATLSAPTSDLRGAIDTHMISTTAICPLGQSLVLGNIIRNNDVKMKNRVPTNIDTSSALFTLFLSKDFQSNRSEFVIFVTPRIVEQPDSAELELRSFLDMEEAMIHERSKKEFQAYLAKKPGSDEVVPAAKKQRKRKWQ